jgi:hypothetical protein
MHLRKPLAAVVLAGAAAMSSAAISGAATLPIAQPTEPTAVTCWYGKGHDGCVTRQTNLCLSAGGVATVSTDPTGIGTKVTCSIND